jgi:hypothetical protein
VRDGYRAAYFRVDPGALVGSTSEITLELRPRRAKTLEDSIGLEVIPMPEEVGASKGDAPRPNINPRWVTSNDPFWKDHRWDERSVAKVISEEDSVDIYVSAENRRLGQLVQRAQRREMAAVDSIRDFYLEHIAFHAFLTYVAQDHEAPPLPERSESGEDVDQERAEDVELERVCETLCGIIDQTFDLLAIRTGIASEETSS